MATRTYLTTKEAAAELGVTQNAIIRAILEGRLKARRPGVGARAGYAIPLASWQAYVDRQKARQETGRGQALRDRWEGRLPATRPDDIPERSWLAFCRRLDGQTYIAIGKELGVSPERAHQLVAAVDQKLSQLVPSVA